MVNQTIPLFEKYRPKKVAEIKGQELAVDKLKAFLNGFEKGIARKKAILLYGPAGTGKTTLAHVFSNELNHELFELNASDLRNRAKLDEVMKPASNQKSLFSQGKIILVDEVDGVTSTEYGGIAELIALIEKTKFPIIITCNDIWQNKFSMLRSKCEMVAVKELSYQAVLDIIKNIAKIEKKELPENLLKEISAKSRGDLRAALNDLQSIMDLESPELMEEQIHLREKTQDIFNALKEVFQTRTNEHTLNAYDNVDLEMDQIILWLEENIPVEYKGIELAKAFEALSKADIFKGRIHRQQYWHFMTYENFFLTAGISAAKGLKISNRFTKYSQPTRILKIWMANQRNAKKKTIAAKIAELTHTSKRTAIKDFNILATFIDDKTIAEMNLSEQEIEYFYEKKQELKNQLLAVINKN
jgi:replication factor C large subunit